MSNFILEETVDFKSEISVIVIRNKDKTVVYPPVENIHKNSILRETIYPAKIDKEIKNKSIKIARNCKCIRIKWNFGCRDVFNKR